VKKYFLIFCLFFFATLLTAQTIRVYKSERIEERDGKEYYVHTVQQGQTVYSIAKAYDVGVDEIYYENPKAKDGIDIDEELWIPTINKETELNKEIHNADFEFFYHIARDNQDFGQLAAIYHVSEESIHKANPGITLPFRDGEYIKIPVENTLHTNSDADSISFDPNMEVITGFRHEVKPGETIYSISKKYNVSVLALRAVNPGLRGELKIGDRLRIPKEQLVNTDGDKDQGKKVDQHQQEPKYFKHRVKAKETLYSISRQYGVTVMELFAANPGLTEGIGIGQIINVPHVSVEKPFVIYVADRRTKIKKVAKLYNIPVYLIQDENPSIGNRIYSGQRVRIPVGKKALDQLKKKETEPELELEGEVTEVPKPVECSEIEPRYDKMFKVALMVPLYLEETDSVDMDNFLVEKHDSFVPFRYLEFYEGALLAADSLEKLGMQIDLHVYDVDQSITKTTKVLQDPELRNMDLIIGPFHSKSFDQVALFAGNFNIPIVNPLSFREEVANKYPTAIKVKSDTRELVKLVPRLIPEYYVNDKVFLIAHTSYQDADLVTDLANQIDSTLNTNIKLANNDLYNLAIAVASRDTTFTLDQPLPNISVEGREIYADVVENQIFDSTLFDNRLIRVNYMKDSLHPFIENASPLRKNLVILYGDSKAFLMDAMNRLNELRDTFNIELVGLPLVERFDNLDHIQANNMNLTYFTTTYIDYGSPDVEGFINKFLKHYKTEPDIYGFNGFDITYFFLNALFRLDKNLDNCLEYVPLKLLLSRYEFERDSGGLNYQNSYWNLIRYSGLSRKKLPDVKLPKQK
jgi:LysM repeat protein